jgi:hypothetical protein
LQTKPQEVPLQVAVALNGVLHGVHEVPQLLTAVLLTQLSPQRWWPSAHESPQLLPSQVATAFGTVGHAVHDAPHVATSVLLTQAPPQRW